MTNPDKTLGDASVAAANAPQLFGGSSAAKAAPPSTFDLDAVFGPEASQQDVYSPVEATIRSVLRGQNGAVLCYGQTSAGKTFTMEGPHEASLHGGSEDSDGIIPRALQTLFGGTGGTSQNSASGEFQLHMSMIEIHPRAEELRLGRPAVPARAGAAGCWCRWLLAAERPMDAGASSGHSRGEEDAEEDALGRQRAASAPPPQRGLWVWEEAKDGDSCKGQQDDDLEEKVQDNEKQLHVPSVDNEVQLHVPSGNSSEEQVSSKEQVENQAEKKLHVLSETSSEEQVEQKVEGDGKREELGEEMLKEKLEDKFGDKKLEEFEDSVEEKVEDSEQLEELTEAKFEEKPGEKLVELNSEEKSEEQIAETETFDENPEEVGEEAKDRRVEEGNDQFEASAVEQESEAAIEDLHCFAALFEEVDCTAALFEEVDCPTASCFSLFGATCQQQRQQQQQEQAELTPEMCTDTRQQQQRQQQQQQQQQQQASGGLIKAQAAEGGIKDEDEEIRLEEDDLVFEDSVEFGDDDDDEPDQHELKQDNNNNNADNNKINKKTKKKNNNNDKNNNKNNSSNNNRNSNNNNNDNDNNNNNMDIELLEVDPMLGSLLLQQLAAKEVRCQALRAENARLRDKAKLAGWEPQKLWELRSFIVLLALFLLGANGIQ
ncbi:unnamed protein product [Polarella glacialis]|uniref:Kinesin motor domain-containing protein n=1 Tax=Polarella glacialis TaxID=89957 RepID=A0A813FCC6_POLGL|nr:unnamed protein product [Polarella glacialis]